LNDLRHKLTSLSTFQSFGRVFEDTFQRGC